MATYKSEEVILGADASKVYSKLNNLSGLGELIKNAPVDQIPADQRDKISQIRITEDAISFPAGPVGEVKLRKTRSEEPELIELSGEGTPVPMSLKMHIVPLSGETCAATVEIELGIPAMLKPMVSGPITKMVGEFANMLKRLPF